MSHQLSFLEAREARDRILEKLAANHYDYLTALRSFAREHALRHGRVSIDDVRDAIAREDYFMPQDIGMRDERVFGAVFRTDDFVPVAEEQTRRKAWAQRVGRARSGVLVYRLREQRESEVA
jgi:hypothetical protein